jgi:hypothetical protein
MFRAILQVVLVFGGVVLVGGCGPSADCVLTVDSYAGLACPMAAEDDSLVKIGDLWVITEATKCIEGERLVGIEATVVKTKRPFVDTPSITYFEPCARAVFRLVQPGIPRNDRITHVVVTHYPHFMGSPIVFRKGENVCLNFDSEGEFLGITWEPWDGWVRPLKIEDANQSILPIGVWPEGDWF